MPPAGYKPTIPASERPQNHALGRAASGMGEVSKYTNNKYHYVWLESFGIRVEDCNNPGTVVHVLFQYPPRGKAKTSE
jgi:hypothetical protein